MRGFKSLCVVGIGVVLLGASLAGCNKTDAPAPGAVVITPTGATNFTSKESRFSIDFPIKPLETKSSVQEMGQTLQVAQYMSTAAPISYLVVTITVPANSGSNSIAFLDGVQKGFLTSGKAKLESSRELSFNGTPGRELRCSLQNGTVFSLVRIYATPTMSYQVMAVGAKADVDAQAAKIDKVLSSFRTNP